MSKLQYAMLASCAIALAGLAGTGAAAARDYPWCAQGQGYGYPGECAYQTYQQCLASVSGRLLYCGVNPRVAYRQPPLPRRRAPIYRP
jgi:hypothetical protein